MLCWCMLRVRTGACGFYVCGVRMMRPGAPFPVALVQLLVLEDCCNGSELTVRMNCKGGMSPSWLMQEGGRKCGSPVKMHLEPDFDEEDDGDGPEASFAKGRRP